MTEYKFANIKEPETCPIEDLEKEVERLRVLGEFYETKQLALKKFINSVYGATASKYFIAHNTNVAESITLQGQDLNHYSENSVNEYFSGVFQNDTELHKKLGISTELAKQVNIAKGKTTETGLLDGPEFLYLNGNQSLTVAGDTDSIYVEFGRICKVCRIPERNSAKFVVDLWNYGCGPYMKKKYEEYAQKYNCDKNIQDLELEKIADTTILTSKKHYAMAECFKEPNIFLEPMEEVVYKGLEIVKGSTPPFARECQIDFTKYILHWYQTHTERPPYEEIISKIKGYKTNFVLKKPEEISISASIGNYEKFILDDKNKLVLGEHCPIHVKAAGIANFFLNQPKNKKYKVKYNPIKTADKVKWYYAKNKVYNCYAFLPNAYSAELALDIDYDEQFEKTILAPCNRIIEILGYTTLTSNLCYTAALW